MSFATRLRHGWSIGRAGLLLLLTAVGLSASGCGSSQPSATPALAAGSPGPKLAPARSPAEILDSARQALNKSDYQQALKEFADAAKQRETKAAAQLGIAQIQLLTGRYEQAAEAYRAVSSDAAHAVAAAEVRCDALLRMGRIEEAQTFLTESISRHNEPPGLRLRLGEVHLLRGNRTEASRVLMTLIEDYNSDKITEQDGRGLSLVGRAAYLLRSPDDANDAFNQAEQVLVSDPQTLLWRAELYLDKYDPGHAEEVITELLKVAPNHPEALVWMAQVKLAQALDFGEARRLVEQALSINPRLGRAFFVLAGLSLRDMKLEAADQFVNQGLEINSGDLELLAMQAAVRFLADDRPGFSKVRDRVLEFNPQYSRFYQIVGEYAEWEHRYDEIVAMMKEAINIDDDDAKAHAQLGLNLIRGGDDSGGLLALRRSFSKDPYNIRVYNTLNLFEKTIRNSYTDVPGDRFNFRYPTEEKLILERYVPTLLDEAWGKFVGYYAFTPETPVGVEMYAERESFAIRTSGLPRTAIQGVCFGKTMASMSPRNEQFNLGMTLWHELAHVFHIQLSKNHVPRWFTEGLAEYETLIERVEWKREKDAELYAALREKRLPKIGAMNEAFTHVEDLSDVTLAYYASTQIVKMLAEQFGRQKLNQMLRLWGEGKRTPQVVRGALGKSTDELDTMFAQYVGAALARFDSQFVPNQRVGNPERVQARVKKHPKDPDALSRLALLAMQAGDNAVAAELVERALAANPKFPDALWLKARLALREGKPGVAIGLANQLIANGRDGYEVQLVVAKAALESDDSAGQRRALERAHELDPQHSDAVYGLLRLAQSEGDQVAAAKWLRTLQQLEEHDAGVYRSLMQRLYEEKRFEEAVAVGESAVFADMEGVATHIAFGRALAASGDSRRAEFEFVSATLCPGTPAELSMAHRAYAAFLKEQGRHRAAKEQSERAAKLSPGKLQGRP